MQSPLRVSVVGAGLMGRIHARVVAEHPQTQLADVVDSSPDAERVAWDRRARWLRDLDELLAGPLPDAAIVSVPTSEHAAVALPLLEAGVPVLVEKPIAAEVEEARALIDAARAAGVALAVGHVERFNPAVRALEERLRDGALGRVFQFHARRLSPFPQRIGDTGVAHDLATHDLESSAALVILIGRLFGFQHCCIARESFFCVQGLEGGVALD